MDEKPFKIASIITIVLLTISCKDSKEEEWWIWDFNSVNISIDIQDEEGNSLINPENPGCVIGESMSMEFDGKEYVLDWDEPYFEEPISHYYLAEFRGLKYADWKNLVYFGEFPGDENYDYTFTLRYDGEVYDIRLVNEFKWIKKNDPSITTSLYLDGQLLDGNSIVLTKS